MPFIISFCTVDEKNEAIAGHGLLSQRRGYGSQGGYAIIFDAAKLNELLTEEAKTTNYFVGFGGDVVYSSSDARDLYDELGKPIERMVTAWERMFRTGNHQAIDKVPGDFIACACLYKHWGFREEREFRFVVVPTPPRIIKDKKRQGYKNLFPTLRGMVRQFPI